MIRVLVTDDHKIVRAGLVAVIDLETDMRVVGQASSGDEALRLYRELRPDVVTFDLKMAGSDGLSAISALRCESPDAKILVLTSMIGDEYVYRAFQAGVLGYLLKDVDDYDLADAIRTTFAGRRTVPRDVAATMAGFLGQERLSAREVEVLRCVAQGLNNQETGKELGISENTVKGYLKSAGSKLNTTDRTAAAMIAMKRGFLEIEKI